MRGGGGMKSLDGAEDEVAKVSKGRVFSMSEGPRRRLALMPSMRK